MKQQGIKHMPNIISLDQKTKRTKITQFELDNEIVFNYFDRLFYDQQDDGSHCSEQL